jgi:ankyrin repeat protein
MPSMEKTNNSGGPKNGPQDLSQQARSAFREASTTSNKNHGPLSTKAEEYFKRNGIDLDKEEVSAAGDHICDRVVGYYCEMPNLKHLELIGPSATSSGLSGVAKLKTIEEIRLKGARCLLESDFVQALAKLPSLKRLSLIDCNLSPAAFENLGQLVGLESLNLAATNVDTQDIKHIAKLTDLKTLWLADTKIGSDSMRELSAIKGLKSLGVGLSKGVDREALLHIAGIEGLESLSIENCPVGTIKALEGHKTLRGIRIANEYSSTKLNLEEAFEILATIPTLEIIDCDRKEIDSGAIKKLRASASLTTIRDIASGATNESLLECMQRDGRFDKETTRSLSELLEGITGKRFDRSPYIQSDLLDAVQASNHAAIERAIEKGANINAKGTLQDIFPDSACLKQKTPMACAIEIGNLETVKYLIDKGANTEDIETIEGHNIGAFEKSVGLGKNSIVDHFIKLGSRLESLGEAKCRIALESAIDQQNLPLAKKLKDALGVTAEELGQQLLMVEKNAQWRGKNIDNMIDVLVDLGADLNQVDQLGDTVLHKWHLASPEMLKKVIEAGAGPNKRNNKGLTPLHKWVNEGSRTTKDHIAIAISLGADPNAVDNESSKQTPLHYACAEVNGHVYSQFEKTAALVAAGANSEALDGTGKRPEELIPIGRVYSAENRRRFSNIVIARGILGDNYHKIYDGANAYEPQNQ